MAGYGKNDKEDTFSGYGKNDKVAEDVSPQTTSMAESALRGFSQGATFGFGDEIQALVRKTGIPAATLELALGSTDPSKNRLQSAWAELTGKQPTVEEMKLAERAANAKAASDNPWSYAGGALAGSIPQAANIASVARAAPAIAQSQVLGSAARGVGAGGLYGAVQGAGNAETMSDVPSSAGKGALIGGATGGVTGALTGKAVSASQDALMQSMKEGASPLIAKQLPFDYGAWAAGGALGNIGLDKMRDTGPRPDYSTDFPGALSQDAISGAKGAALGLATRYGGNKLVDVGGKVGEKVGKVITNLGTTSASPKVMFGKGATLGVPGTVASKFADRTLSGEPNQFQQVRDYLSDLDPDEKRKRAMEMQSTPEGRAQTMGDAN